MALEPIRIFPQLTSSELSFVQSLAGLSYAQGDILYHNGSNLVRLAAGTSGHFLKTNGAGANPEWAAASSAGANTALSNLASVAINTSLVSDTNVTDDLGTTLIKWNNIYVANVGATGTRVTKGWFTDIESTNMPTVGGTSLSSTFAPIASPTFTGTVTVPATNFTVGTSLPFSDSAGTLTLQNIDALDATTEATIEAAIDTLANLTSIQGHTITLTGAFVRSGAHSLTLTTSGVTDVTLPTTGTLATLAGAETLTNKTLNLTNNTLSGTIAQFNTALSDADFATLAGTETLTNKTLTAPKIADTGFIADENGNEQVKFSTTASAVNEITIKNAATGGAPDIQATGGDTNIDLKLTPKGTGKVAPQASVNFGAKTAYFTETDNGNSGTADTIDWTLSNKQKSTLTGNVTFTFTAPPGPCNLVLKLVQDATGSRTVTWPATVKWSGGSAPTLTTTASRIDIITFYYDGTNYYGTSSLNYTA